MGKPLSKVALRICACKSRIRIGSRPISSGVSTSRRVPSTPARRYVSPQPTRPSSVSTRTKIHGRQPASHMIVSTFAMRIVRSPSEPRVATACQNRPAGSSGPATSLMHTVVEATTPWLVQKGEPIGQNQVSSRL